MAPTVHVLKVSLLLLLLLLLLFYLRVCEQSC
jgi:hypothetical protein